MACFRQLRGRGLHATLRYAQANPAAIGKPRRLCLGSLPVATSAIPNAAQPMYSRASRSRILRLYRESLSARSVSFQAAHIAAARTAEEPVTATITSQIIMDSLNGR